MKLILGLTLLVLSFAEAAIAQSTNPIGLRLRSDDHAYEITVTCANADCSKVEIKYGPGANTITRPPKSQEVLKVSLTQISQYVAKASIPKEYALPSIRDIKYDPSAGGLNLFLPVIWTATLLIALPMDAYELASNPNAKTLKAIENLKKELQKAVFLEQELYVNVRSSKTFSRMIDLIEEAALAQELRGCKTVIAGSGQ